jgi:nickel-type superoxide dismutase maturation protease
MNRARSRSGFVGPTAGVVAAVVVAVGAVLAARPRRVAVTGPSMEPTLTSGDRILVFRRGHPRVGEIVAVDEPGGDGRLIVKRVVAVTGDDVIVEGDNAASSTDSRVFGPVERRSIVGRALYRYFPPERAGPLR